MVELAMLSSSTTEDPVWQLEQDNELLQNENQMLRRFLQRVQPEVFMQQHQQAAQVSFQPAGLLIGEKAEICTQEIEQCNRTIERCAADGDAEQAHLAAAIAECKLRIAETSRDAHDLLKLLGLLDGNAQPPTAPSQAAAAGAEEDGRSGGGGVWAEGQSEPLAARLPSAVDDSPGKPAALLKLPSAKQLARVMVPGDRVEKFLEEYLRRHDTSIERLHMRAGMLKVHLTKLEHSLSAKLDIGGSLQQVDYEQLKIQHAQAQQKLSTHSAESVALKMDTGIAVQVLADLRNSLTSGAGESAGLQRRITVAGKQLEALQASVRQVQSECEALARECEGLRRQKERMGDGDAAHILDYIKLKSAAQEAEKKIADYHRKIEVASLRARRPPPS